WRRVLGAELQDETLVEDEPWIARKSAERFFRIAIGIVEPRAAAVERDDETIPVLPDRVGAAAAFAALGRQRLQQFGGVIQLDLGLMGQRAENRGAELGMAHQRRDDLTG